MFENILVEQNPHWKGDLDVVKIERNCFPILVDYIDSENIVTLTGVRRSGKSTLLSLIINHLIQKGIHPKNILHLRLEETRLIKYSQDPEALQRMYEEYLKIHSSKEIKYLLLDEVQFFKDWPVFVKSHFETKDVKFVITGSNSQMLSSDMMTLLSGRTLALEIFPLSFEEFVRWKGTTISEPIDFTIHRNELRQHIKNYFDVGGFPAVIQESKGHVRTEMLNSYAKTVIYRDVAPRLNSRKSLELEMLYSYLISNIGKLFSYHNLAKLFKISDKTVKDYIGAFQDAFLLFEVDMFSYSVKEQIRYPKKVYCVDVGQAKALSFRFSENWGRVLENVVFLELKRLGFDVYYYKTSKDQEVDFCVRKNVTFALIQVAWEVEEEETKKREIDSLLQGMDEMKKDVGLLITHDHEEEIHMNGKTIHCLPIYKFACLPDEKKQGLLRV